MVGLGSSVIIRHALFSSGSIFLAWHDATHTAEQYSKKLRARAVVRKVLDMLHFELKVMNQRCVMN